MSEACIGILGLGPWGQRHLVTARGAGRLVAAFDPDPERAASATVAERRPSEAALLADPAVRGVIVATPAPDHAAVAQRVLAAGKDVLVEKPLALSLGDAEGLVAAASARGAILMEGHVTLYHPAIEALLRSVEAGLVGSLRYVHSHRLNRGLVRRDEDILWSFAPHDLAFFHRLAGLPARVFAHGGAWIDPARADVTVSHFDWVSGLKAHVFVSWLHARREQRLVVVGDRGALTFEDEGAGPRLTHTLAERPAFAGEPRPAVEERSLAFDEVAPLDREQEHFVARIRDRAEPRTGGRHALGVARMLAAATESLRSEGRAVVLDASLQAPAPPVVTRPGEPRNAAEEAS